MTDSLKQVFELMLIGKLTHPIKLAGSIWKSAWGRLANWWLKLAFLLDIRPMALEKSQRFDWIGKFLCITIRLVSDFKNRKSSEQKCSIICSKIGEIFLASLKRRNSVMSNRNGSENSSIRATSAATSRGKESRLVTKMHASDSLKGSAQTKLYFL